MELSATPCRYGGVRWLLVCPASGRRCLELFWSNAHGRFVSRQTAKLTYPSQTETSVDRMRRAWRKAEARAYGWEGYPRPRGDNRRRLMARARRLETAYAARWACAMRARFGRHFGPEELDGLVGL